MRFAILAFSLLAASGCYGEHIQQQKIFSMDKLQDMNPTSPSGKKFITLEENGRSGKCLRFNTMIFPENMPRITAFGRKKEPMLMTMNHTHAKLELANDIVELSIYVRGKGSFVFGLYHYDQNQRNIGVQNSREIKVNSPADWQKVTVRLTLPLETNYFVNSCDMLPGIIIFQKSDLYMDDFSFTIYSGSLLYSPAGKTEKKLPAAVGKTPVRKAGSSVKKPAEVRRSKTEFLPLSGAKLHTAEVLKNGRRGKLPPEKILLKKDGIELAFELNTPGEDAVFFTVDLPEMEEFNEIRTTLHAGYTGKIRPFLLVEDAGSELHYFPMIRNRQLLLQQLPGSGVKHLTTIIDLKNPHKADRVSQRWGGDRNQKIDFPVKRLTLGVDDLEDGKNAKGTILFKSLEFIKNK